MGEPINLTQIAAETWGYHLPVYRASKLGLQGQMYLK